MKGIGKTLITLAIGAAIGAGVLYVGFTIALMGAFAH